MGRDGYGSAYEVATSNVVQSAAAVERRMLRYVIYVSLYLSNVVRAGTARPCQAGRPSLVQVRELSCCADHGGAGLKKWCESVDAHFAVPAAGLEATVGRGPARGVVGVDPDHAGLDSLDRKSVV